MCIGAHPFIPAEGTIKAELIYTTPGGVAENVIYFQTPDAITSALLIEFADLLHTSWSAEVLNTQGLGVTLNRIVATDVSVEDSFQITEFVNETGVIDSPILPSNATLAVSYRTGLTGRSNRGRSYHIGLTESQVGGDVITGASGPDILAAYSSVQILMQAGGFTHVIASYCEEGEWRTDAKVTPVLTYVSDFIVDSQRRRLSGRGI